MNLHWKTISRNDFVNELLDARKTQKVAQNRNLSRRGKEQREEIAKEVDETKSLHEDTAESPLQEHHDHAQAKADCPAEPLPLKEKPRDTANAYHKYDAHDEQDITHCDEAAVEEQEDSNEKEHRAEPCENGAELSCVFRIQHKMEKVCVCTRRKEGRKVRKSFFSLLLIIFLFNFLVEKSISVNYYFRYDIRFYSNH